VSGSRSDKEPSLLSFTLDTNCVISLDKDCPEASAIRRLAEAHATGKADVAVVAIMASEKQRPNGYIEDFQVFEQRLQRLSIAHLRLLLPICYFDITFWGQSLWSDTSTQDLERKIHQALFPYVKFFWQDYCRYHKLDPAMSPTATSLGQKWRNRKCDVLTLWSHVHHGRDVFVTSDEKFHKPTKKPALLSLGARKIDRPEGAAALLL
jgi:hypothetical protein